MTQITKQQALEKIEELKKFIAEEDNKKEEKVIGIAIKNRFTGSIIFQSTKTTYKDAVQELLLSGADPSGADLSDADFSGADLRGVNFRSADLSDADFSGADLRGADFRDADFRGAELNCAKFFGRGDTKTLTKAQLPAFLGALGFIVID